MAGLDCAEVSPAAWATLRTGIHATVTVTDGQTHAAMRELHGAGLRIGDCGAAPLAALRALAGDDGARAAFGLGPDARVLLLATEGPTDPEAYLRICG
jgi:diaminopropionate ammonia-lyase